MQTVTPINQVNNTLNFYPANWNWEEKLLPFKASVAITDGYAVGTEISSNTTTWYVTLMPATNANGANFRGILIEKISATDTDYATAGKLKKVMVPTSNFAQARFKVWTGTFTAIDEGKVVSFHSDSAGLAVDTAWAWAEITKYIDSSYGLCMFSCARTVTA